MQQPGRPQMAKTGRGIPKELMGPGMYKDGGPQIGQGPGDGIIDNIKSTVKRVGERISTAHQRGSNKYYTNTGSERSWSDFGGGGGGRSQKTYNPGNYVTGFVQGLVSGEAEAADAKKPADPYAKYRK